MHALQTAVIEHTSAQGIHHDWLIEDPRLTDPKSPDARLWTARVAPPPGEWARIGRFMIQPIAPHRRAFLAYQGPVSGDRGRVKRLASGTCLAKLWSDDRIALKIQTRAVAIELGLNRLSKDNWLAERIG